MLVQQYDDYILVLANNPETVIEYNGRFWTYLCPSDDGWKCYIPD